MINKFENQNLKHPTGLGLLASAAAFIFNFSTKQPEQSKSHRI
jgi:hypothetical protein